MTREEAVIILDGFKNNPLFNDTHAQALDMAISALSENKGDLISRQAVDIDKIPSVENKGEDRPKGHWIGHREHCENLGVMPNGLGVYEWCSNCDCGIDVREWQKNHYNFCPNCGADMRRSE